MPVLSENGEIFVRAAQTRIPRVWRRITATPDGRHLDRERQNWKLLLGNYTLEIDLRRNRRVAGQVPALAKNQILTE
jgi:hypothetical protein